MVATALHKMDWGDVIASSVEGAAAAAVGGAAVSQDTPAGQQSRHPKQLNTSDRLLEQGVDADGAACVSNAAGPRDLSKPDVRF